MVRSPHLTGHPAPGDRFGSVGESAAATHVPASLLGRRAAAQGAGLLEWPARPLPPET